MYAACENEVENIVVPRVKQNYMQWDLALGRSLFIATPSTFMIKRHKVSCLESQKRWKHSKIIANWSGQKNCIQPVNTTLSRPSTVDFNLDYDIFAPIGCSNFSNFNNFFHCEAERYLDKELFYSFVLWCSIHCFKQNASS